MQLPPQRPRFPFVPYTAESRLRVLLVALAWAATFLCIQQIRGVVPTGLVVTARVAAVLLVAGALVVRAQKNARFLDEIGHYTVMGACSAVLPWTLFFCITTIVPPSAVVVAAVTTLLSFAAAAAVHVGQPIRLRVFASTNAGIITSAFTVSTNPSMFLQTFFALLVVVTVNLCAHRATQWYGARVFADPTAPAHVIGTQSMALAFLLPIVSWYVPSVPVQPLLLLAVLVICVLAVVIRGVMLTDRLFPLTRGIALLVAPLAIIVIRFVDIRGTTGWLQWAIATLWGCTVLLVVWAGSSQRHQQAAVSE